jgi:hypothetical protein
MTSTSVVQIEDALDIWNDASPALRTVVAAVRTSLNNEVPKVPEEDPDWERVLSIAYTHQVTPLVYEGLPENGVPSYVRNSLREEVQKNAKRNLRLTRELVQILDLFDDADLRAIPYKGPVLASVAHGDLSRRMFGDLDLLVHPDDVLEAGRVLRSNGYVPDDEFVTLRRLGQDVPVLAEVLECSFFDARTGDEVELRWKLGRWAQPLNVSFEDLWQRRDRTTLAGRDMPILSPEDRLLVLCGHGSRHAWRRLEWIVDVSATLRAQDDLDWDSIERHAGSWGVEVALHTAIVLVPLLCSERYDVVPDRVLNNAQADARAVRLAERAATRLASDPLDSPREFEEMVYDIVATDSFQKLASLVTRQAFQPRRSDYRALPLPTLLWPTYYLFKVVRAVKMLARATEDFGRSLAASHR